MYVGWAETNNPDGITVQRCLGFEFSEYWTPPEIANPALAARHGVVGNYYQILRTPDQVMVGASHMPKSVPIPPADTAPPDPSEQPEG